MLGVMVVLSFLWYTTDMATYSDDINLNTHHRTLLKRLTEENGISPSDVPITTVDDYVKKNHLSANGKKSFRKSRDDKNEDSVLNVAGCLCQQ